VGVLFFIVQFILMAGAVAGFAFDEFDVLYINPILYMLQGIFKLRSDYFITGLARFLAAYLFIIIGSVLYFHQQLFRLIKIRFMKNQLDLKNGEES